jgi:integrase
MGVKLREKKIGKGKVSFYLDITQNKERWYEFLEIHVSKTRPSEDDKIKRRIANEIRAKRENEIIFQGHGLVNKSRRNADFVEWFAKYVEDRKFKHDNNTNVLCHLRKYVDKKPLPFEAIKPQWIKGFSKHLLENVKPNSAIAYNNKLIMALDVAMQEGIISQNPFHLVPRKERIKKNQTYRNPFSMDELQLLNNTPCDIDEIKKAFLFSCFTGLRWSDVNCLRWSEILTKTIDGKQEWFIYFEQEKTEAIEYLPLSEQAIYILKERKAEQKDIGTASQYVFPYVKETDTIRRLKLKHVSYHIKKWAKRAGLDTKRMYFHSSRHTFATNVLEYSADGDLWTVAKLLGHKSVSSTQMYAHVGDKRKKSAVNLLPRLTTTFPAA